MDGEKKDVKTIRGTAEDLHKQMLESLRAHPPRRTDTSRVVTVAKEIQQRMPEFKSILERSLVADTEEKRESKTKLIEKLEAVEHSAKLVESHFKPSAREG